MSRGLISTSGFPVPLRILEYYEGILILTTNRLQQFDIAVMSRVNLSIMYNDLTASRTQRIFSNFFGQLNDGPINEHKKHKLLDMMNVDSISSISMVVKSATCSSQ